MFTLETLTFEKLSSRWVELKNETSYLKEHFLAGQGSHYLFTKFQRLSEEYDQLDRLIEDIQLMDKKLIKKKAA